MGLNNNSSSAQEEWDRLEAKKEARKASAQEEWDRLQAEKEARLQAEEEKWDRLQAERLSQSIRSGKDDFIKDPFTQNKIYYIAKDGTRQTTSEGLKQANQEYNDRTFYEKPKFSIDDPESQGRITPYINHLNPDDKFSK